VVARCALPGLAVVPLAVLAVAAPVGATPGAILIPPLSFELGAGAPVAAEADAVASPFVAALVN
jgi:hypothetical protein